MFYLKQYNNTLLKFDIVTDNLDGQKILSLTTADGFDERKMPIGVNANPESVMKWLKSRIIPKNREFVYSFLEKNGLSHNDIKGILQTSKGLSLNDSYWIVEDDNERFEDYNLYEHDFLKALSLLAYTGYGSSPAKGFTSSPEFTTSGMLRKGWRRLNGKILLYKGGNSNYAEPYITKETYNAVQTALQSNIRTGIQRHVYLFTGLLRCPECRSKLVGVSHPKGGKRYYYYRCNNAHSVHTCTHKKHYAELATEKYLLSNLDTLLKDHIATISNITSETKNTTEKELKELRKANCKVSSYRTIEDFAEKHGFEIDE